MGEQDRVPSQDVAVLIDQDCAERSEGLNAVDNLADLLLGMNACVIGVRLGSVNRPHLYWVGAGRFSRFFFGGAFWSCGMRSHDRIAFRRVSFLSPSPLSHLRP